jgi:hypothetical protein
MFFLFLTTNEVSLEKKTKKIKDVKEFVGGIFY